MSQRSVSRSLVGPICLSLLASVLFTCGAASPAGRADASATGTAGVSADVRSRPVSRQEGAPDLCAFADDAEDGDDALIFTVRSIPAPGAGVTIDANRRVHLSAAADWTIATDVNERIEDGVGPTDSDRHRARVGGNEVYLPLVMMRWPPIPDVPVLHPINNPDGDGTYVVSWSSAYLAAAYVLQEDDDAAFPSPTRRYRGPDTSWSASGKSPGTYYYRVKATNTYGDSSWSTVRQVTVTPPRAEVYVKNDTGGRLCYEVKETGIGEKCFSSGTHFYGGFPSGTYTWHASASCGSASGTRHYEAGEFIHRFWCE